MYLLPAIDILDGSAVRLAKGDYNRVTIYNKDPLDQAKRFEESGATWMHIVDLDGAKTGEPININIIEAIASKTQLNIEVGGGIRSMAVCERLYNAGATRMVLGTALVKDPEFAQAAIEQFGTHLSCGIDARDGEVSIAGWCEGSGIDARELARQMSSLGYEHIVYTDIARDGMQTGIDVGAYDRMARAFEHPVVVSGGISCVDDIRSLASIASRVEGVIAGRAIYEGSLSVEEGVAACEAITQQVSE